MKPGSKCNFAEILCQFFKEKWLLTSLLCAFSLNKVSNGSLSNRKLVSDLLLNFVSITQKWFHFYFPYSSFSTQSLQHSFHSSSFDHSHICNFSVLYWSAGICSWKVNTKMKWSSLLCVKYTLCSLLLWNASVFLIVFIPRVLIL